MLDLREIFAVANVSLVEDLRTGAMRMKGIESLRCIVDIWSLSVMFLKVLRKTTANACEQSSSSFRYCVRSNLVFQVSMYLG